MKTSLLFLILFALPATCLPQQKDTLIQKNDSLNNKLDSTTHEINNIDAKEFKLKKITFRSYFTLLADDFKQQLTAPFHTNKKGWMQVAKFGLLFTAVSFADKPVNHYSLNLRNNNPAIGPISGYITRFGGDYERYTLLALGTYSFIFKNEKLKTTTLLASQAYITSAVIERLVKLLTGRQRPAYIDPETDKNAPTFHGPFFHFKKDENGNRYPNESHSAFPSGHTTVAYSVATVFAMEYGETPIVGIISYSTATLIGISRLIENKHWLTDVLTGAALGYLCGKQVVNNYRRYAKIEPQEKKASISFNVKYFHGKLLPGFIYRF